MCAFFLSLVVLATAFGAVPQRAWAGVDDYPSSLRGAALDALVDPWNFYNRECTSFAAWRLNNRNGMSFHNYYGGQHWGNANHWDDAARASGIPVNNGPAVGAIAQTDAGNWGHVAWVESVNAGGTVTIEDYNHLGTGVYSERTVAASAYVYIRVHDLPGTQDDPLGAYDSVASPGAGQVAVRGWSFDPNANTSPVTIHVYVGGQAGQPGAEGHNVGLASAYRPDVARVFPGVGDYHGFDVTLETSKVGQVPVCVYAINIGPGSNPLLDCKTITVVELPVPRNTQPPSIHGTPTQDQTMTAAHGSWRNGTITGYGLRWERCEPAGAPCTVIAGTMSQTYVLTAADVGHRMRVEETATNARGSSAPVASSQTAIVKALPRLTALTVGARVFSAAREGPSVTQKRTVGTKVHFQLNVSATVRFRIEVRSGGRKGGLHCDAPSPKNRTGARCTRWVMLTDAFSVNGRAGENDFRFSGRLGGRRLAAGAYRLTATPAASGVTGAAQSTTFTIRRPA